MRPLRILSPLHKATRQLTIHLEAKLAGSGASASESHVLSYVHVYGPCRVGELVRVFGHKKPTMTSMLDRLAEAGFVTREVNPADRRSVVVALTPDGARLARAARRMVERLEAEVERRVTATDLAGFDRVTNAITEITGVELRAVAPALAERVPSGSRRPVIPKRRKRRGS